MNWSISTQLCTWRTDFQFTVLKFILIGKYKIRILLFLPLVRWRQFRLHSCSVSRGRDEQRTCHSQRTVLNWHCCLWCAGHCSATWIISTDAESYSILYIATRENACSQRRCAQHFILLVTTPLSLLYVVRLYNGGATASEQAIKPTRWRGEAAL